MLYNDGTILLGHRDGVFKLPFFVQATVQAQIYSIYK